MLGTAKKQITEISGKIRIELLVLHSDLGEKRANRLFDGDLHGHSCKL